MIWLIFWDRLFGSSISASGQGRKDQIRKGNMSSQWLLCILYICTICVFIQPFICKSLSWVYLYLRPPLPPNVLRWADVSWVILSKETMPTPLYYRFYTIGRLLVADRVKYELVYRRLKALLSIRWKRAYLIFFSIKTILIEFKYILF